MKKIILGVLQKYLAFFPEELKRQSILLDYLKTHNYEEMIDWNNFDGHIVASGFVYSKEDDKFLVLYHNDMKMFLYPGGHIDSNDINILQAAKREIKEETGLENLELSKIVEDELVPFDIDTHKIGYNERLNLPEHYHFDFRYLFMIDNISDIKIDNEELSNYKWISIDELRNDVNYGGVVNKILNMLRNNKHLKNS